MTPFVPILVLAPGLVSPDPSCASYLPIQGSRQAELNLNGVAASAENAKPLQAGAPAPNATVRTMDGKTMPLKQVFGGKPTVVVFYRGGWCPFCNMNLADLVKADPELRRMGFQLVGISPDLPSELQKTSSKNAVTYRLISDAKADAMRKFGVAYRMDDALFNTYRDKYGIDLERSSGEPHHILPVPSVFILDAKGVVRYTYSNPDYRVRLKSADLLVAAKAVMSESR